MAKALYNKAKDEVIDKKRLKGKSPAVKKEFEKLDKKHKEVKYQNQDNAIDTKLMAKAQAKVKAKKK